MTQHIKYIYTCLFIAISLFCNAQNMEHAVVNQVFVHDTKISVNQEISQSRITDIIEDERGFIWFGTMDGLNKYDGYTVKIFRNISGDSTSISNNQIIKLLEDREGYIWIATANGINKLNPYTEIFSHFIIPNRTKNHITINDFALDKDQNLWYSTDIGLFMLPHLKKNSTHIEFQKDSISSTSLLIDQKNRLWIGSSDSLIRCYDLDTKKITKWPLPLGENEHPYTKISKIYEDKQNRIWFSSYDYWGKAAYGSTFLLKPGDKQINNFEYFKGLKNINELFYDYYPVSNFDSRDNEIWTVSTTLAGIVMYNFDNNELNYFIDKIQDINGYNTFGKTCILIDSKGLIWEGSNGNGINILSSKRNGFSMANSKINPNLAIRSFRSFCEDDENYWLGGYFALAKMNKETKKITTVKDGILPYAIINDPIDNQYIIIGSEGAGIKKINKKTGEEKLIYKSVKADSPWNWIFSLSIENDSICWAGCSNGVMRINLISKTVKKYDLKNTTARFGNRIVSLYRDFQNRLWIGSDESGLGYYSDSLDTFVHYKYDLNTKLNAGNVIINSITQSKDSVFWISTSVGLLRIHHDSLSLENHLPNNYVYAALPDEKGLLWLSTNNGICSFNSLNGKVISYADDENLQDKEFNTGAYYKAHDGTLFFGGIKGFNYFKPSELNVQKHTIPIRLVGVKWFNKNIPLNKEIIKNSVINIPPDVNYFNIEVAGINYINSQWTKYKYRIKEFGQDWIELGTRHEIGFQSLKPGEYHLEVTASDHGKDWNEDIFKLKIIVQAYFWQTRWFWMIFSLIMIISASLIVRSRFKNIKSQKQRIEALVNIRTKELQTANLELKKANETKDHFFTIISHDLKNPIGAAKSVSHELKENFKDYNADDQQEFLNILDKSINSLANLLKDLLTWSRMQQEDIVPHPEEVILLKCVNRTLEVLSQNIQKKELEIKIDISEDLLLWVDKNILSTIIRNLLSNAIKFTPNGGQISISTLHSSQEIIIQFKDNGIGIPDDVLKKLFIPGGVMSHPGTNNEKGTGMGLVLLKEFIDLCNGEIWVESTVGKGSVFFVSLPAYLALSTAK